MAEMFRATLWLRVWNVFLALMGVVSVVLGGVMTYKTHFEHPQLSYVPVDDTWKQHLDRLVAMAQAEESTASPSALFVEVAGAVQKPGVFSLYPGARVQDAILHAGGFLEDVSQKYVHQELHLAEKVFDQQKIYIPFQDENPVLVVSNTQPSTGQRNLNQATQKELEEVNGVGAKRAEQILQGMPYSGWEDFQARSGIPESILAEIKKTYVF